MEGICRVVPDWRLDPRVESDATHEVRILGCSGLLCLLVDRVRVLRTPESRFSLRTSPHRKPSGRGGPAYRHVLVSFVSVEELHGEFVLRVCVQVETL